MYIYEDGGEGDSDDQFVSQHENSEEENVSDQNQQDSDDDTK